MKMHYQTSGIHQDFKVDNDMAQEGLVTLEAVAVVLQTLVYYPKKTAPGGTGSPKPTQQPTIKSAISVTTEQEKKAKNILTQELVNDLSKVLDVSSVCVRILFGSNCDERCNKPHDHIDTDLNFGIEHILKAKVSTKVFLPAVKEIVFGILR